MFFGRNKDGEIDINQKPDGEISELKKKFKTEVRMCAGVAKIEKKMVKSKESKQNYSIILIEQSKV